MAVFTPVADTDPVVGEECPEIPLVIPGCSCAASSALYEDSYEVIDGNGGSVGVAYDIVRTTYVLVDDDGNERITDNGDRRVVNPC